MDNTRVRRERLRALRAKYRGTEDVDFPEDRPDDREYTTDAGAGRLSGPGKRRGPRGGGQAGKKPNRGRIAQRMLDFLLDVGPGAKTIPGTPVNKDRLKRVIQFIKIRVREGNPPKWAKQFQRVLNRTGSVNTVDDLSPQLVNQIVRFLTQRVRGEGVSSADRDSVPPAREDGARDQIVHEESTGDGEDRLSRIEQSVQELQEMTGKLFQQLTASDEDSAESDQTLSEEEDGLFEDEEEADKDAPSSKQKGESIGDWFDNFIEEL